MAGGTNRDQDAHIGWNPGNVVEAGSHFLPDDFIDNILYGLCGTENGNALGVDWNVWSRVSLYSAFVPFSFKFAINPRGY